MRPADDLLDDAAPAVHTTRGAHDGPGGTERSSRLLTKPPPSHQTLSRDIAKSREEGPAPAMAALPTASQRPPQRDRVPARAADDGAYRPLFVGVDIGGTKIAVLVVDRAGTTRARVVA